MSEPAIQSINQHTQKTSLDWLYNILIQPSSGDGSGVSPATHEQFGLSLDLLRQALVEVTNVVNVLTTTVPGKVLDARQGKVLADAIAAEIAKYAQPNGIATLGSDGKIPSAQIPSIALVDVFPVDSEAEMLASGAEQGDMAIRSDTSQVFILSASPATTIENWIELSALKALVDAAIAEVKGSGYTSGTLKSHEDAITTLNADDSTDGSVAKTVKDAIAPVSAELSTVKVKSTENDLAIADIQRDQTLANQSEAKISVSDYGIVALPKNATGSLKLKREGLTARNMVNGASVAIGGTVTFASVLNDIYYDVLNKVQITGTGSNITATNNSGAIANMAIIDLTQTFSSIPTLAQCKKIFPTYFADTKNVPFTGRYRGRGKNLFDEIWEQGSIDFTTGLDISSTTVKRSGFIKVKPSTQYALHREIVSASATNGIRAYDIDYNYISFLAGIGGNGLTTLVTTQANAHYIRIVDNNEQANGQWQLELGTAFTPYAPFEAHDLYLTAPEGRSVPSAKDSVEVQDGRLVHVKRVSEFETYDETAINLVGLVSDGLHYRIRIDGWAVGKNAKLNTAESVVGYSNSGTYICTESSADGSADTAGTTGKAIGINVFGNFCLFIEKALIDAEAGATAINKAHAYLTAHPVTFHYQLATPITTNIDSSGNLPADASVVWEPAIPDVGIYTDKFDILDTDHPIASIDKLYKVDFTTGVQTQLTDAVVAGDGLSFTSASLTAGDLVNVIYFYATANPEGLTTAEYLNSNVVIADTANGKYYTQKPKITNGIIQPLADWTLTEVV